MRNLTPSQFEQLRDALCDAFYMPAKLSQMVRFSLDENLSDITADAALTDQAFNLIQWAISHGRLQELIDGAVKANPGNPALKVFVSGLETPAARGAQSLPLSVSNPPAQPNSSPPSAIINVSPNPFTYGSPVRPNHFVGRCTDLRRVIGRIVHHGESTAIIGEPHIGKSSLLHFLQQPSIYGDHAEQLCFSYLDAHALAGVDQIGEFWRRGLAPLGRLLVHQAQLQMCEAGGYSESTLDRLVHHLATSGQRLVLLIDEFDSLLHHPVLNSALFFGGLRAAASLSRGALAVVIASRIPLAQLNAKTQAINPSGSPFFNIYAEITLNTFGKKEVDQLLARAGKTFNKGDRRLLSQLTGGHPFLLQAASNALWDAYTDEVAEQSERNEIILGRLHKELRYHFADTWQNWSPEFRQAFTAVALVNLKGILGQRQFQIDDFLESLPDWVPELKELAYIGFVEESTAHPGGWRISQTITLAWLLDELTRAIRSEDAFGRWLAEAQLEGRWTEGQRKKLWTAGREMRSFTSQLLVALAQGFGEGLSSGR